MKKNDDMQEQDVSSSVAPRDDDDTWIVRKLAKALYHGTSKSTLINDKSVSVATDSPPSPALTAVDHNDDLYSRRQPPTTKSRRTIRSCLSALLMVVIGTLVALAFILIGVGSALTGNEDQNDHSATFAMPSAADADNDVSNPSSISTIYTTSSSTTTTTFIQPAPSL